MYFFLIFSNLSMPSHLNCRCLLLKHLAKEVPKNYHNSYPHRPSRQNSVQTDRPCVTSQTNPHQIIIYALFCSNQNTLICSHYHRIPSKGVVKHQTFELPEFRDQIVISLIIQTLNTKMYAKQFTKNDFVQVAEINR